MALKIIDDCFNCGICEIECPYEAIYPGGYNWRRMENKYLGFCKDSSLKDKFYSNYHYYIVPDLCNECKGISDVPKCLMVCPISGIIPDPDHWESEEHLYSKKVYLDTLNPWRKDYV
jgi:ferredoxin